MQRELDWFYGGGAGQFFPDRWKNFVDLIPEDERGDLISAYARRLFSDDMKMEIRYARAWASWENGLAAMNVGASSDSAADYARAFARLENHYFNNKGWLESDGWILQNRQLIEHIPTTIVQGRYDMICPPRSAYMLADGWKNAQLRMIPTAGHALSEPGITAELIRTTDNLRDQFIRG